LTFASIVSDSLGGAARQADEQSPHAADLQAPGLPRRMACWIYEGVLLFGVVFVADWLFTTLAQMRSGIDPRRPLLQAFLFLVLGVYFTWFWSKGQTLAMKTWHIRVLDAAGRPVTQMRAAWRYICSWLWFLPPMAALAPFSFTAPQAAAAMTGWVVLWALSSRLHPQRQFWHDVLAGTRLVPSLAFRR
jgi:uncharacterized RDD family membrane protein YckC